LNRFVETGKSKSTDNKTVITEKSDTMPVRAKGYFPRHEVGIFKSSPVRYIIVTIICPI